MRYIFIFICLFLCTILYSQISSNYILQFEYDTSGNQIKREFKNNTAMAVGKIAAFGATYIPTDDQLEYVKKMSDKYGVSYENVQWRKGGIYQVVQPLWTRNRQHREVVWGNTVVTFDDTDKNVFGHEFGHIIQFSTQGWATFQGKGIFEQLHNNGN